MHELGEKADKAGREAALSRGESAGPLAADDKSIIAGLYDETAEGDGDVKAASKGGR